MEINSQNDTLIYNNTKEKFILDYAKNRFDLVALEKKYGEDVVNLWVNEKYVLDRVEEIINAEEIRADQFNHLKTASYKIVDDGLKGAPLTEHQVKLAMWVLSGERAFAESFAKAKGEQKAQFAGDKDKPKLKIVIGADETDL